MLQHWQHEMFIHSSSLFKKNVAQTISIGRYNYLDCKPSREGTYGAVIIVPLLLVTILSEPAKVGRC